MDLMLLISIAHALVNSVSVENVNKMNLLLPRNVIMNDSDPRRT